MATRKSEFDQLQSDGADTWGDHLVPVETQNQLRLDDSLPQSPVATTTSFHEEQSDFPFEEHLQQLPYFRNKMVAVSTKWGGVQRLLRDRENQLEMSLGNMVLFLEGAEQLVEWVGQWAGPDVTSDSPVVSPPPARQPSPGRRTAQPGQRQGQPAHPGRTKPRPQERPATTEHDGAPRPERPPERHGQEHRAPCPEPRRPAERKRHPTHPRPQEAANAAAGPPTHDRSPGRSPANGGAPSRSSARGAGPSAALRPRPGQPAGGAGRSPAPAKTGHAGTAWRRGTSHGSDEPRRRPRGSRARAPRSSAPGTAPHAARAERADQPQPHEPESNPQDATMAGVVYGPETTARAAISTRKPKTAEPARHADRPQ